MRHSLSALALALFHHVVFAQDCPTGYNRTIEWHDCPTEDSPGLQCAVLTVPRDYLDKSSSASIAVPLVRVLATTPNPNGKQSIVYNPGGPGGSGIAQFAGGQGEYLQKIFGTQFNFISFDPRGVALSTIFEDGVDNYNCDTVEGYQLGPYQTDTQLQYAVNNATAQGQACAKNPVGMNGQYISSPANARDIVAVTQALAGEDGLLRYYGASYGTLLGATLAAMFPDKAERILLDGNINPTDYYYGLGDEAEADVDAAVIHFFNECATAGPKLCALADKNQTGVQLRQEFNDLLTYFKSIDYTVYNYLQEFWGGVLKRPDLFSSASQDLYEILRANETSTKIRRQIDDFDPEAAPEAESLQEAKGQILSAVTCGDYLGPRVATVDSFRKYRDLYESGSYYTGSAGLVSILLSCSAWTVKSKDPFTASLTNVKTRNPVLFVNSPYDPVTPLISAQNSSAGFVNSAVLITDGAGHCSSAEPNPVLNKAMAGYFADGKIPTQRVYNKTGNSFSVGQPTIIVDPNVNTTISVNASTILNTTTAVHATHLKQVYPRELLRLLGEHATNIQKRATNTSSSGIPAGCTPVAPGTYVGAAGRTAVGTTAMIVAIVAALLL